MTHVGGPRWQDAEHPAYRAILAWVREASTEASSKPDRPTAHLSADGYAPGFEPSLALDGDEGTYWQTEFLGASPGYPHELTLDLGTPSKVDGLLYVPRQDSSKGRVKDYEVRVSDDGKTWSEPVARGTWADEPTSRYVTLNGHTTRFVQLRVFPRSTGFLS